MATGIPEVNFGRGPSFRIGVEEELLLVDPQSHALAHTASEALAKVDASGLRGHFAPDTYEAEIELKSGVSETADEAVEDLRALRGRLQEAGYAAIGSGLHPSAAFGDVVHVDEPRYHAIRDTLRGLITRTPTAATHVHVGMPDPATAILAYNGLRSHLPLLQALSANSPFWYGLDSGFATARAQMFRAYPRSEIPRAFRGFEDYAKTIDRIVSGAEIADYTFLWWDVRPHPLLGTIEVRAMDAQAELDHVAAVAALIHGLALHEVASPRPADDSGVLMESSFRAARDGLDATIWADGELRSVPEVARRAVAFARRHVDAPELDLVEKILREGNGAAKRRAAFESGGMAAMLTDLVSASSVT